MLNMDMMTKEVFENVIRDRETYGIAYCEVIRSMDGQVVELQFIIDTPSIDMTYPLEPYVDIEYFHKGLTVKRKKKFRDKDPKTAVAWIFADAMNILEKLGFDFGNGSMRQLAEPAEDWFGEEYAKQLDEMITLNDRAMFSSRLMEETHRESLLSFRNTTIENINKQEKWYRRFWLKWFKCLY